VWAVCGGSILLALPFWLLRSGHYRFGNIVLITIVVASIAALATVGQGIHDLAIVAFPIVIIYAGLISDRVMLRFSWGLTFIALLWLAFGESFGLFVTVPLFHDPLNLFYLLVLTVLLIITALAVELLSSNMRRTIELARREIEERKKAERALKDANDLFSQFLLHSPIYAYIKKVSPQESRVIQASENFKDMVGIPGHEMAGKRMEELFPADFAAKITADDWNVVSSDNILELEEELNNRYFTTIKFPISRQGERYLAGYTIDITERKKAEMALRQSEAKFRAVVENAYDGILFTDTHATIHYRSPSCNKIDGFTDAERIGHSGFETVHPDDIQGMRLFWAKVLDHPEAAHRAEYRIRHKDGTWRWIESSGRNLLGNFDVQSVVAASRDITERKQTEEALRASEERFRRMFERHSAAMMVIDPEAGNIIEANEAAADFYGWPTNELKQMSIQQINALPPETVRSEMDKAKSSERIRFEFSHRIADGSTRDVEVFSSNIEFEGKTVLYAVIHDVTDRKLAEKALRESEARFRTLIDQAPVGISVSRNGIRLYANQKLLETIGLQSLEGPVNRPISDFLAPQSREESKERTRRRAAGLLVPSEFETIVLRKDGTAFPAQVAVAQVQLPEGIANIAFVTDLTERRRAEEENAKLQQQLTQAQKMESVGRLAGGVAHDFNNMLGVILGHTEMALQQVDSKQPLHDNLEEIRKATNRSADLTRQLLAFARRQTVTPEVLDLNGTVEGTLKMLQRMIGEEIRLEWQPGVDLWQVRIDPSQIDQILANLCVNARDAISGVGTINIETRNSILDEAYCAKHPGSTTGEYAMLGVRDDGCGMNKETLSHLFEPFFTTKAVGAGTGLGLATVYGITKQNGGFIEVSSEQGHGATFRVYLPRYSAETAQPKSDETVEPVEPGQETILIVEDEAAILKLATLMLEEQGYKVLAARTPGEGMRLANEHKGKVHLLMTDVVMPEMNGRELSQKMLSLYPNLKCLFMSGYTADVISNHGVLDEGVSFIHKPFSIKDLSSKIRETLNRQ
jgi:PAS domain S-box-containing protein